MAPRIRYHTRRRITRTVGRALQAVFTRTTVRGLEHVPARGPYIAVGNHAAALEVVMMAINLPQVVELVGNGDVPLDPIWGLPARWYGFIPIRRGYVDRAALTAAKEVLEEGHVLGIFPEGGIWEQDSAAARPGVAWLSQQTGAPILPIGFSGMRGALGQAARLRRPRLTMTIGPLMPAVDNRGSARERRAAIDAASQEMMARIQALVPDPPAEDALLAEDYAFSVEITAPDGAPVALPAELAIPYGEDVAFYFHRQVLLEVVYRNYRLSGARPLADYPTLDDPARLGAALEVALDFYRREPAFLDYRLGYARAGRVIEGLAGLRRALAWAADQGCRMRLCPERTIMRAAGRTETWIAPSIRREF